MRANARRAQPKPSAHPDGGSGDPWRRAEATLSMRSPQTCRAYLGTLRGFRAHLDRSAPTADAARAYLLGLRNRGLASVSIMRHQAAIGWFFRKVLGEPPPQPLDISREEHEPRWLSQEELSRFLGACSNVLERAIAFTLADSGCRIGELLTLTWDNVNDEGYLTFWGKGGRERTAPVDDLTIEAIRALPRRARERRVFPFSYDRVRLLLHGLAARARVPGFTPHALRHTCATLSLHAGQDVRFVAARLGHRNLATTMIYTHLRPADLRAHHPPILSNAINSKKQMKS